MVESHHYSLHLFGVMDRLWFQQIILSSEPNIPIKNIIEPADHQEDLLISSSSSSSGSSQNNSSFSSQEGTEEEEEITSSTPSPKDYKGAHNDAELKYKSKRPKKLSNLETKARSKSSSPSLHKLLSKQLMREHGAMSKTLRKTSSCKGLHEQLEYEELKGFMDLGFRFNKEELCPRMMSVLPGLQRLDDYNDVIEQDTVLSQKVAQENGELDHQEFMEDKKKYVITRPYLSEAWLIKSPNSPLLNLRMPDVSDRNDMKKHLKSWARTVATVVQVEQY